MSKDKNGREYARFCQLKSGDVIELDEGFTCHDHLLWATVQEDENGLFFECNEGKHRLNGQLEDDHVIGVYKL